MNRKIMKWCVFASAGLLAVAGCCFGNGDSKHGDLSEHGKPIRRGDVLAADGTSLAGIRPKPMDGTVIRTTIDRNLQQQLSTHVRAAYASNRAENAWGIIIKVQTGEILSMVSVPDVETNEFGEVLSDRNNALEMAFQPTTLMKPFTCAIAMNEGIVNADSVISQSDRLWRHGKDMTMRDRLPEPMTVTNALKRHADIVIGKLAVEIGKERLVEYVKKLGSGTKVLKGELPHESVGWIWPNKIFDDHLLPWIGIGGYFQVTPIQIAKAYATLANHGVEVVPYIISEIVDDNGRVLRRHAPDSSPEAIFSPEVADCIVAALPGGTPATTQMYKDRRFSYVDYVASYVGFFPASNPEYVTVVGLSRPKGEHTGMKVAFPIFAAMLPVLDEL